MLCEGDITVIIFLGDADAVHVIIEHFSSSMASVEIGDSAHVISVILEAAARSE